MTALDDRRRAAREAFEDEWTGTDATVTGARDAAIETASRVRVTPEIERAFQGTFRRTLDGRLALRAAFEAAGFEVEK